MSERLPRNKHNMLQGWLLRAELQKLLASRLQRGEPIDQRKWAYCAATTMDAINPGRDRIVMMPSGHAYGGRYYRTWAECLPANIFCEGSNRLALTLDEVPDALRRVTEAACKAAGKRRYHIFLKGQTIARMLGVTSAERSLLGLRIIGAIDMDTKKEATESRRDRDRVRAKEKRRAAGATPREKSIAQQAREMGISPAALRMRPRREQADVTFSSPTDASPDVTFSSPQSAPANVHISSPYHEPENTVLNQCDGAHEMQHVTFSSPHKYTESISFVGENPASGEAGAPATGLPEATLSAECSDPGAAPLGARPVHDPGAVVIDLRKVRERLEAREADEPHPFAGYEPCHDLESGEAARLNARPDDPSRNDPFNRDIGRTVTAATLPYLRNLAAEFQELGHSLNEIAFRRANEFRRAFSLEEANAAIVGAADDVRRLAKRAGLSAKRTDDAVTGVLLTLSAESAEGEKFDSMARRQAAPAA